MRLLQPARQERWHSHMRRAAQWQLLLWRHWLLLLLLQHALSQLLLIFTQRAPHTPGKS
jgi:hypothetical protein